MVLLCSPGQSYCVIQARSSSQSSCLDCPGAGITGVRSPATGSSDSCELPMWVLGIECRSSGRTVSALNH
ncbi:hypothetical protein LEMLEM_LOCUS24792 [Lemmus lemmus]